jgi:endonuclease G
MYSEKLEHPIWVKYNVRCPDGNYPRKGMDFYTNDSIHTSDNLDYENDLYDKGHLAPAADFNCDRATLLITFSYLNCALQNQYLNRGVWKKLEVYERELAKNNPIVEIKILCVYSKNSVKKSTGATVPDGFYKIITYSGKTLKFYFPNKKPVSDDYNAYLVK